MTLDQGVPGSNPGAPAKLPSPPRSRSRSMLPARASAPRAHNDGMSETFRAVIQQTGKTACGIEVPEAVVTALGGSKRPAVVVTLDGYVYRSTVAPMSGGWWVGVNADHRAASGLKGGDEVQVTLDLDTAPRELDVPAELATALDAAPDAKAFFEGLSYSNKRVFTESVTGTSNPETKARRVEKAIALMREGRVR